MQNGPDVEKALARIKKVRVAQDLSGLTENERAAMRHCVAAAKIMNDLYLSQIDPANIALRETLAGRTDSEGRTFLEYFDVNGGPWDLFNGDEAFIPGVGNKPKAGAFYPADLTDAEWESWLAGHPADRTRFESPTTVIRRDGNGGLVTVPYHEAYRPFLERAAAELKAAAALLPEGALRTFLIARATAILSDDYWESDIAWIDTDGNPFEVTIGPYEVYADGRFGIKATYEALVALPDREATAELEKFKEALPEFDAALAARIGYRPKGAATPMEVVNDVFRGGEAAFGRAFVAFNLPNDRRIHEAKGSKKVFSKTMMDAKFAALTRPVAERLLRPEVFASMDRRHRLLFVMGHELAHGVGPGVRNVDGREVSFEVLLKDLHGMLEEAKADMLGMALLDFFSRKGMLTKEDVEMCAVYEIAAFPVGWRVSYEEAHSAGSLIEYNWLVRHGAVRYDERDGVFAIDPGRAVAAMVALSEEFLKLQLGGDYEAAKVFVKQWGTVAPEIPAIVARMSDLPIEVHAVYEIE